jgi:hypothetical protein
MYWYPAPLSDEGELSSKVWAAGDVQAPPQQCVDDNLSDSSVGSDDEDPAARRAPAKVPAPPPRCTW